MFGFKHIFKSWKTSLIGLLLIGGAIVSVLLGKTTWADAMPIIIVGCGFLGIADPGKSKAE
jgi:hypothetical protein